MSDSRATDPADAVLRQAIFELADAAEPVPELEDLGATVITPNRQRNDDMNPKKWIVAAAAGIFLIVAIGAVVAAQGDDDDDDNNITAGVGGDVTIESRATESRGDLATGGFTVSDGVDVLGCSSGAFADVAATYPDDEPVGNEPVITRAFTCESGPNVGTFTVDWTLVGGSALDPLLSWSVVDGTEDYEGIEGDGRMTIDFTPGSEHETFTGTITFRP